MAMRPRTASGIIRGGRPPIRPVYEDFRPFSEWKQEQGADIVLVHLPGFMREQIKVTNEPSGVIKARGERPLENNKWSRFDQDYRIPEYCTVTGIRAKFEGGILSITMPKKIVPSQPTQAAKTTQQPPSTSKPTTSLETPSPITSTQVPKPQKSPEDRKPTVDTPSTQVTEKDWSKFQEEKSAKSPSPKKVATEPKPQKITEEDRRTTVNTPSRPKVEAKTQEEKSVKSQSPKTESMEPKPQKSPEDWKTIVDMPTVKKAEGDQPKSQKRRDDATESEKFGTLRKEKRMDEKINEHSTPAAGFMKKILDKIEKDSDNVSGGPGKDKAKEHDFDAENITGSSSTTDGAGGDQLENFNKIVQGLTMKIKKDRESLVNIGVAVLVIVALGVYMCY